MGKRTYFEDIASIALLYNYQATARMLLSYDKIKEYDEIINNNLDKMNSNINYINSLDNSKSIYFYSKDENDKEYLILKPYFDFEKARYEYIGCLPLDIIIASQKENALEVIGLELVDGKLLKKDYEKAKVKKLSLNHN